ncbi:MAG: glycosyltransferase [Simkaniaceae bacterium]|nr:glycosyltransferase [Simkaniaceae bacterium]
MLTVDTIKLLPPVKDDCEPFPFFNLGYDPRFSRMEGLRSLSYPVTPLYDFKKNPSESTFFTLHEDIQFYCYHAAWSSLGEDDRAPFNSGERVVHQDFSFLLRICNHEGTHLIDQLIHMIEGNPLPFTPTISTRLQTLFHCQITDPPLSRKENVTLPSPISVYEISLVPPELYHQGWRLLTDHLLISSDYPEWMIEKSDSYPEAPIHMIESIRALEGDYLLPTQRLVSYEGKKVVMTSRFHLSPLENQLPLLTQREGEHLALSLKRLILQTGYSPSKFSDALALLDGKWVIRCGSSPSCDIPATLKRGARELSSLSPFFRLLFPKFSVDTVPLIRTDVQPPLPTEEDKALCHSFRVVHVTYEYGASSFAGLGVAVTGLTEELSHHVAHQLILCPSFPFIPDTTPPEVIPLGSFEDIADQKMMYQALTPDIVHRFSLAVRDYLLSHSSDYDAIFFHDYHGAQYLHTLGEDKIKIAVVHNHLHWGDIARTALSHVSATICVSPQFAIEAQSAFGHGLQPFFHNTPQLFGIENGAHCINPLWNGLDLRTQTKSELLALANTYLKEEGYPLLPEDKKFIVAIQRYDTYQKWIEALASVQEVVEEREDAFFISLGISEDLEASSILDRLEGRKNNWITRGRPGIEESKLIQQAIGPLLRYLAHLTVILSRTEMGGLVVHEANSCGSAVIATKTGGLMNSVIHGENGFLTDLNPKAVKGAIHQGLDAEWDRSYLMNRPLNHTWKQQVNYYLTVLAHTSSV